MQIATWNINGVKARLETALAWLEEASPDVVCFQEIKSEDAPFPRERFEALGYQVETHGQKGFNGVALLSKTPLEDVTRGLPGDDGDVQARFITGRVTGPGGHTVRVAGLYLPNGNPLGTEKFPYKLSWMERLLAYAREALESEEPLVLAGDYNVIPDARDLYSENAWTDDALYQPESRAALRRLEALGFTDAIRAASDGQHYTFWDYQGGCWPKNHGIRIDHLMLSPQLADQLVEVRVDDHVRGWEKPSDHVPVVGRFTL
ncbi:MAG: exodeoxyribonuclease III [Devosiaceae bacterium]|nr:exodeoxyribonuclease III [Devosiaceae bacterium MH13]